MTKEHVESFKQQMVDVIRYAKEHPYCLNQLAANDDDDTGLIARGLSNVVDGDGATHASVSIDVTRVGSTQPIPITLSVAAAHDGMPYHVDNMPQVTGGVQLSVLTSSADSGKPQLSVLTPSADSGKPGGSWSAEMSSDAEYYTPLGSPDESRQSSAANTIVHIDDLNTASALTAAVVGKVINLFLIC